MQCTKLDYILVGQGIAGTWLSYELLKREKSIVVINEDKQETASRKAAGLYNPITGRKMVKTWKADDLFPSLEKNYQELEKTLKSKFLYPLPIYRPFPNITAQNDWHAKMGSNNGFDYVSEVRPSSLGLSSIEDSHGGVMVENSGYVDIPTLLNAYKKMLVEKNAYEEGTFLLSDLEVNEQEVMYKNYSANKIIFCSGSTISSFWNDLPFRLVRGDIIDIVCELPRNLIINQGIFIIPKNDYFTVGSTYDHNNLTFQPQESGIMNIEQRLKNIFTGEYEISFKRAGVRPATHDRRPYIGFHKKSKSLGIFNGFGAKGVSLTPYFAKHFADVLEGHSEIEKEVDVKRVYK